MKKTQKTTRYEWAEMSDAEKIEAVVAFARNAPVNERPSYNYLASFLEEVGRCYEIEKDSRKTIAVLNMVSIFFVIVFATVAALGWLR